MTKDMVIDLKNINFDKVCRGCLTDENLISLFNSTETLERVTYSDMFMACTSVAVSQGDGFPSQICDACIYQIYQAYIYRKNCVQINEYLMAFATQNIQNARNIEVGELYPENCSVDTYEPFNTYTDSSGSCLNKIIDENEIVCESNTLVPNNIVSVAELNEAEVPGDIETKNIDTDSSNNPTANSHDTSTLIESTLNCESNDFSVYCTKCNENFDTQQQFSEHKKTTKHRQKRTSCPVCSREVAQRHLQVHMRTHTNEKPYKCGRCDAKFSVSNNLKRHEMTHTGERPYQCKQCGKGFIQATALQEHESVHSNKTPFICDVCGKTFKQNKQMKRHFALNHEIGVRTEKDAVTSKVPKEPPSERKYKCTQCNWAFATKAYLTSHSRIHGEKKFLCSECGRGFVTKIALRSHSIIHTGEKPHRCLVCGKTFAHHSSLKNHITTHTGAKPYTCKICLKSFAQSSHLKTHSLLHSGIKPFKCSVCGKKFSLRGNLTVHMKTHSGEQRVMCIICGKAFGDLASMDKHRETHAVKTKSLQ